MPQTICVFLLTTFVSFNLLAQPLTGLPREIDAQSGLFEMEALENMGDHYHCQVTPQTGDFELLTTELQEFRYADYLGELAGFEVKVVADLGALGCDAAAGKVTCRFKYELYDEKAYRINVRASECD